MSRYQLLGQGPWEEIQAVPIGADPKPTKARPGLTCIRCGAWTPLIVWRGKAIYRHEDVPGGKIVACATCAPIVEKAVLA